MKAVLLSIRPEWVAKILNGEKTIEVRKVFPNNYRGWIYIYCTKAYPELGKLNTDRFILDNEINEENFEHLYSWYSANGKVVARFWCDNVEEVYIHYISAIENLNDYETVTHSPLQLEKGSCLTQKDLHKYLNSGKGNAIHIAQLEIFGRPKELSEFSLYCCNTCDLRICSYCDTHLTKAPQNYCYVRE